jgi:hypothetical protein
MLFLGHLFAALRQSTNYLELEFFYQYVDGAGENGLVK